jgi:hypothetical protein
MTSPVAVAATRILAAYLSNHKLSPAEAASLSETIVAVLGSLVTGGSLETDGPRALAEEPAPKAQAKPRLPRRARVVSPEPAIAQDLPAPISEPVAEPEPEAEPEIVPEAEPVPPSEPAQAVPAAQMGADMAAAADLPRKRKRPSRPRSRRGKGGAGAAPGTAAMPGEEPEEEVPEDHVIAAPSDIAFAPEPVAAEAVAETPAVAPKPRRETSPARRVTAH